MAEGRLLQHDPVRRGQPLADGCQRPVREPVLEADSGHYADPLRLDKDLALVVLD